MGGHQGAFGLEVVDDCGPAGLLEVTDVAAQVELVVEESMRIYPG
jgi:hypothetical protein